MTVRALFIILVVCPFPGRGQVSFQSSNLPILIINSNGTIVDEPKSDATLGIIDNGPGKRNFLTDPQNGYSGKIAIEIRGSSSQTFPKKQYAIELRDEAGNDIDASLLGMPAEEDWVLLGPYNDKTLMRDALAYKLGSELSRYAPRTRYCELVLNDSYEGVYLLIEKIKRSKDRVDISKLNPDETLGDAVTGGYILKIDKATGATTGGFYSAHDPIGSAAGRRILFRYHYPGPMEIVPEQKTYIQNFMASFENALAGDSFDDPLEGYQRYIDVSSFVDFLIINEVSKNVDGYRLSTYFYKEKDSQGGKLHMGPIWDFNLGFGNANYCSGGDPEGFAWDFNYVCPSDNWQIPFWWYRLRQDDYFMQQLSKRWYELRADAFSDDRVIQLIDSLSQTLDLEAQQRNFVRWPVLDKYIWPNLYVGPTYADEISWLKSWVQQRMEWLDANFPQYIIAGDETLEKLAHVSVYPNPFDEAVVVQASLRQPATVTLQIVNTMGQIVHQSTDLGATTHFEKRLNLQALSKGAFVCVVYVNEKRVWLGRIMK